MADVVTGYRGWVYQNAPATESLTYAIALPTDPATGQVLAEYAGIDFTSPAVDSLVADVLLPGARATVLWTFTVLAATAQTLTVDRVWQAGDTAAIGVLHFQRVTPYAGATALPEAEPFTVGIRARP